MFESLLLLAGLFFLSHVCLLAVSIFGRFHDRRYFWSHGTLWICGVLLFLAAVLFAGQGKSDFLDYFDTPLKKAMILVVPFVLSSIVHGIVKVTLLKEKGV